MANEADNSGLGAKIDVLIKLMALSIAPPSASLKDRATILSKAGLAPKEIAELCDTTPNTVSQTLTKAKRAKKR